MKGQKKLLRHALEAIAATQPESMSGNDLYAAWERMVIMADEALAATETEMEKLVEDEEEDWEKELDQKGVKGIVVQGPEHGDFWVEEEGDEQTKVS